MPVHDWTLVAAGIFHDFHHEWISTIKRALNAGLLPPNFYALAEQVAGGVGPDVLTLENGLPAPGADFGTPLPDEPDDAGGVATAIAPPKVRIAQVEDLPYGKLKRIAIRHVSGHRVVAMIEIVSPGNKASQTAFDAFVAKVHEMLRAGIHLLIIDLFPPTPRDERGIHAAIWEGIGSKPFEPTSEQPLTLVSYQASVPKRAFAETVAVGDDLPAMPLFYRADRYIEVPLASTYHSAWEAVPSFWREKLQTTLPNEGS